MPQTNLSLFLLSVVFISLSGVIMPGPVFAATVAKGYSNKHAGAWIAFGHGVIEFPLIALLYLGVRSIFQNHLFMVIMGIVGGGMLIYMGYEMIRMKVPIVSEAKPRSGSSLLAGLATTVANPYFFLWWATVGAALVVKAMAFGLIVVAVFAVLHWLCDLVWDYLVGFAVFRVKRFWGGRSGKIVFALCGSMLVAFGLWFILSPLLSGNKASASPSPEGEGALRHVTCNGRILLETPYAVCAPVLSEGDIDPHLVALAQDRVPQVLLHSKEHLEFVS
jgi:threonine/homoserine/homoserine lactone efflux protein